MRIVIVGAGLTGLTAARALTTAGHSVTLLDKGRSPGGRLATRRIGEARLDHGAQFFTVRSPEFQGFIDPFVADGTVLEWCRGFTGDDGHARYVVAGGMNALAKRLATGLDVRCSTLAFAVRPAPDGHGWSVQIDDGTTERADAVIVTCPLPQAVSLLVTSGVTIPDGLVRTDYDRTLALLTVLDGPSAVPAPGGVQHSGGIFSFVADNQLKGISAQPALTFHAAPAWSLEHWDTERTETVSLLLGAAAPWLGSARVLEAQLKRWRFAAPQASWPDRCWRAPGPVPLVIAGDAFAGPKIEGAHLSGLAAADSVAH